MRKIYIVTLLLLLTTLSASGQCLILANAVAGLILDYQSTSVLNCSGVAYNPGLGRYYGVRAGNAGYPMETWASNGAQLYTTTAGFDWRGMWWNHSLNQLEGNGFSTEGIWKCDLDGAGNAIPSGVRIFSGMFQPDIQSIGDWDYFNNELIYYYNGSIFRYSRATSAFLGSWPITGLPVALSNLNSNSVVFTGCPGKDIGLLDYVNKRIYLVNGQTYAYVGTSQLPGTAATASTFRFSWANGYAWLFNASLGNWYSYRIFDQVLPESDMSVNAIWFSPSVAKIDWTTVNRDRYEHFFVERSVDGFHFEQIDDRSAADDTETSTSHAWSVEDGTAPRIPVLYYRVKAILKTGEVEYSELMTLTREMGSELSLLSWPNPADRAVNFQAINAVPGATAQVVDMAGRVVHQQTLTEESAANVLDIETHDWTAGIYLLHLSNPNGQRVTQRLVVHH